MDERCPTCGQSVSRRQYVATTAAELVAELRSRDKRMVYRFTDNSGWGLTYGGRVSPEAVADACRAGLIHECYSNAPGDAYWLGRTIDVEETLLERKRTGKKDVTIYA